MQYEILEHPGDIKIRIFGKDDKELFANAALGMTSYIYGQKITEDRQGPVFFETAEIRSPDKEALLVDWLSEILYRSETNKRAYTDYEILDIKETDLKAKIGSIEAKAIEDIKAVTYSGLKIEKEKDHWEAEVVFDI